MKTKPLGGKSYGSIPHLPGSKRGPGDHGLSRAQAALFLDPESARRDWTWIVQEKLDGANVAAVKLGDRILALIRPGYLATDSPYPQHHAWDRFVSANVRRFDALLSEGERVCGEWMMQACGTRYHMPHEPFVAFDLRTGDDRIVTLAVEARCAIVGFRTPRRLWIAPAPCSIDVAVERLVSEPGLRMHGAIDPPEGAIWRLERPGHQPMLAKWVRPDHDTGRYLEADPPVLNSWTGGWTP